MNGFAELIKSVSANPSVIIHLGAGTCSGHDLYKAIGSDQIIYVEPDQHLAEAATDTFNNAAQVKVIPYAIAAENGQQTLNITNNRRFSSLLLPGELLDFYPNIEVDNKVEVEAITLTQLCQDEEISKESDNLLVTELQGMEKDVFASAEVDTLQKFKWIIIRSSKTNLYTPVSDNAQRSLSEVLQKAGFTVLAFEDDAPPFVNFLCLRDDAAIDNKRFKAREADSLRTTRVLEQNLSKQKADLADLQTRHAKAIDELKLSLTSKSDKLSKAKTLIKSITSQKENQQQKLETLTSNIDAKTGELAQAHKQIQSLSTEKEDQQQQILKLSNAAGVSAGELEQAHKQIQAFTEEKNDFQQQIKELASTVDTKSDELAQAHKQIQSFLEEKNDFQQQIKELASTVDTKSDELAQAHKQIQSFSEEKNDFQQQIKDLASTVNTRSDELAQAHKQTQSYLEEKNNFEQQIKKLEDSVSQKETELNEMQQILKINNKLNLKSDMDLRDLQEQYRTALQHQDQQHLLLSELKEKLRQASAFYQKLNIQNLVIESDMLEQDDPDSDKEHDY